MITDILKAETKVKPSKVAFQRIDNDSFVSVHYSPGMMTYLDSFEWIHSKNKPNESITKIITEAETANLLRDIKK